jgi:predicted deacylase
MYKSSHQHTVAISNMIKSIFAGALLGSGLTLAQTNFTGDVLHGYPVISALDIADVPANTISRYWISAAQAQGGLDYFIPIFVARGTNSSLHTGRKLSISASIHGDELNGIPVVQRVFSSLGETVSSGGLNGTIIGLPTLNPNGNIHNQRNFWTSSNNGFYYNLNRLMPGVSIEEGGNLPESYDYTIWNNIWGNTSNVDIAVDLRM